MLLDDFFDALAERDEDWMTSALEQLNHWREDRRRTVRPWRRRGRIRLLLRRGPGTRRPGRGLERLEAGPPPNRVDW